MPYRSAHHALICAFVDHSRPRHASWQDIYQSGYRATDEPTSLLAGMEEVAGEAAMVLMHLSRLPDDAAAVLILRTCPPRRPHKLVPHATVPHPLYRTAARWLVQRSQEGVGGLRDSRARYDAVVRACGAKINVGLTADKAGVSRDTIERLNGAIKRWIGPIEDRAWREMEDRLQSAGLIVCVQTA